MPGHVEDSLSLSQVWGEKSYSRISCCQVAETECWHPSCLRGSLLSAAEWVDDGVACKDEDVSSDGRRRLDEGERLTANFNDWRRTRNRTDVAAALFSSPTEISVGREDIDPPCALTVRMFPKMSCSFFNSSQWFRARFSPPNKWNFWGAFWFSGSAGLWVTTTLPAFNWFYTKNSSNAALKTSHKVGPSRKMINLKIWWLAHFLWLL